MMARLLLTEWERFVEKFRPIELPQKKPNIRQYAIPLYKGQRYPRVHIHVIKKDRIWMEIWAHMDWKRHNKYEMRNEYLIDFITQLKQI